MEDLKYDEIIKKMALKDKVKLCSGAGLWNTEAFEQYGIKDIFISDGPNGLRKQEGKGDNLGINNSKNATCFPTEALCSSTWNINLIEEMGKAIGEEALEYGVDVVLGPGVNIKRNPLCGRNFEYFSEDPYISGRMAAAWIKGIQSTGIGACVKHFACNNQENERFLSDSLIDERTLREIYLLPFEIAVKEGNPDMVMSSYNKINGIYASENNYILREILREQWGFDKVIITDWGAMNNKVESFKAGLDLEMPTSGKLFDKEVIKAVKSGNLDEIYINQSLDRIISLITNKVKARKTQFKYDRDEHHKLAEKIAEEGAILLKNEDNILPIKNKKIALIGELANKIRYEGAGSSHVNPTRLSTIIDGFKNENINFKYYGGYDFTGDINEHLLNEAINGAKESDIAVIVIGLPDYYECEGIDRTNMKIPYSHIHLLEAVRKVNENIVVVLLAGSPVEMEWINNAKAVLNMYLGGQAVGEATVKLLTGKVNPSGKLTETYPINYEDNPSSQIYDINPRKVEYREGIYVGYRYYDKAKKEVRFPFGFGLSYTNFKYDKISLYSKVFNENDELVVSCKVKNIGQVSGKEVVQLYVSCKKENIYRPIKELKAFEKVNLLPNEEKLLTFNLNKRSFAYYDVTVKDWTVEEGTYEILIGSSSMDIKLKEEIEVEGSKGTTLNNVPKWYINPIGYPEKEAFEKLYGAKIEEYKSAEKGKYDLYCTLNDMKNTKIAQIIMNCINRYLCKKYECDEEDMGFIFIYSHLVNTPLKRLVQQQGNAVLLKVMKLFLYFANK